MFCPNCGTENSKGQKFCTRCGMNLLAIDRAREIIGEMTANAVPTPSVSPNLVFGTVALVSVIGFIAITLGTVELSKHNETNGPEPIMFALGGFAALILICRYLLKLIAPPKLQAKLQVPAIPVAPPQIARGATNRSLNEAQVPYQSIIEDPTRQFEHERRSNS